MTTLDDIMGPDTLDGRLANMAKGVAEARIAAERAAHRAEEAEGRMQAEMGRFIEARDEAVRTLMELRGWLVEHRPDLLARLHEVARG